MENHNITCPANLGGNAVPQRERSPASGRPRGFDPLLALLREEQDQAQQRQDQQRAQLKVLAALQKPIPGPEPLRDRHREKRHPDQDQQIPADPPKACRCGCPWMQPGRARFEPLDQSPSLLLTLHFYYGRLPSGRPHPATPKRSAPATAPDSILDSPRSVRGKYSTQAELRTGVNLFGLLQIRFLGPVGDCFQTSTADGRNRAVGLQCVQKSGAGGLGHAGLNSCSRASGMLCRWTQFRSDSSERSIISKYIRKSRLDLYSRL